jgi:hypothetical protein
MSGLVPVPISVIPLAWQGVRDTTSPSRILDEEWVDCRNVDAKKGGRRRGDSQVSLNIASPVKGLSYYRRPDGSLHLVSFTEDGKLWDDTTNVLSGLNTAAIPDFGRGSGFVITVNGVDLPRWRDPADNVWKNLQNFPSDWRPKTIVVNPLNRRIYVAPAGSGVDSYGWSNPEPNGSNMSFVAAGGGGAEPIGGTREPITAIRAGLGDDTCIFGENHIFQLRGLDPSSWTVRFVSDDVGTLNPAVTITIGHGIFFVHASGAYLVNALGAVTFPPLTEPKGRAWKTLVETYGDYMKYAHATWHAREHTVYLFLPTSANALMGQLWKFYLPDGSISIHDVVAYSSSYVPDGRLLLGKTDGKITNLGAAETDLGTPIDGWVRTKIYGGTKRTKTWGIQQKIVVLFRPLAGATVNVISYIYRDAGSDPIEGPTETVSLTTGGDMVRATVALGTDQGWGLQLKIRGSSAWEFLGFEAEAFEEDIE